MAINWSDLVGGGSGGNELWSVSSIVADTIPSGVTGNILTVTAPDPENQRIRLYAFFVDVNSIQEGITLTRDGENVFVEDALFGTSGPNNSTQRGICRYFSPAPSSMQNFVGCLFDVTCKTFTVTKNAGNTTFVIRYAYEILERVE